MKGIKITTSNIISLVDVPENGQTLYDLIRKAIGGYMENVYPKGLPKEYVMIVDDMGKLKGKPVNLIGSFLYGSHMHGDYIVGNVIILKLGYYQGECDVIGIPDEEANVLMNKFAIFKKGELK